MVLVCTCAFFLYLRHKSLVTDYSLGKSHYQRAFGRRLVKEDNSEVPLEVDATFCLASCTKLMTTVAALQCVERGLVTLDEDVTRVLPELQNLEVLTGFDRRTQRPLFIRRRRQLTLRFVESFLHALTFFESLCSTLGALYLTMYVTLGTSSPIPLVLATRLGTPASLSISRPNVGLYRSPAQEK